jgi:TRAP transporter TAXI family solute receptor
MRRAVPFAVMLLAVVTTLSCARQATRQDKGAAPNPEHVSLRFAAGPSGGEGYRFGPALADALNQIPGATQLNVVHSGGSVANLWAIQRGEADVALTFADVTYLSFMGQMADSAMPFDNLRAIAVLKLTPVQLIARDRAQIHSVRDLKGRRVSVGPEGSGTAVTARLILNAFGIYKPDVMIEELSFSEAGNRLVDGTLDAMFDNTMRPTESALSALKTGSSLVPITGGPVDRLRAEYPFLRLAVLPGDANAPARAIPTVGVDSLLICRRDLNDAVVHDVVSRLFPALSALSAARHLTFAEVDEAPSAPIPLHDGALRYYREQELAQ